MPIYEYKCSSCAFQDEHLQKMNEKALGTCPSCGQKTYKKMLSAAGFQLKGSGWYATDFKGGAAKPAEAKAEAKPEGKSEAKAEAKAEARTEAKGEAKKETATPAVTTD